MLCSVALDLRVTQLVDGTKGIHGMLAWAVAGAATPAANPTHAGPMRRWITAP